MTGAALLFNAERHEYRRPDRDVVVPSVTQILRACGISTDFEALPNQDAIARKRDIGTAVHADAHAYDDDDLDRATVHPDVEPYLAAWVTFRLNTGITPVARERRLFHDAMNYAGTMDGIFRTRDGQKVLIDIKTGDPESAGARYQLAAYLLAYLVEHPDADLIERWSVQLTPGHRMPYRVTRYDDWRDVETWRAIVATYYAQPERRRTAA